MHPFLASAPDPFTRCARAHFWQVIDSDFTHSAFWADQVREAEEYLLSTMHPKASSEIRKTILRNATSAAYEKADKCRRMRVVVGFDD